jgi:signal peptidase I
MNKFIKITTITLKNELAIIIFAIVPIVLFILITSRSPIIFGIRSFVVQTGSMEPKIHVASIVFTKPLLAYQTGDIITFNRGNITFTHRIAGIKNNQYQTKGDANNITDPQTVSKSKIIGKDFIIIPYIGRISEFLKTIPGYLIFIVLPILLFIAFELLRIKKEIEKQVEARIRKQFEHNET